MRKRMLASVVINLFILCIAVSYSAGQESTPTETPRPIPSSITSVAILPDHLTLVPGETRQFSAAITGTGAYSATVSWSVNDIVGGNATVGTISATGLYATPYPAPAAVVVKATSTSDATKSAAATLTFSTPSVSPGPALSVNAAGPTRDISPFIYGMNAYQIDPIVAKSVRLPVNRWGGNATTRYNYKLDVTSLENDWFFEVIPNSNTQYPDVSEFNTQVLADRANGTKTMGTVPVIGWVVKWRTRSSSFSVAKYGPQQKIDRYWPDYGNGIKPDGSKITNNDPTDTSMPIDETWAGDWVKFLVKKFGNAASGGVAIYSLDNEPNWWDLNHRDVHPLPFTYDEVTNNGLKVARAVKAADPTAAVSGPVIDFWPTYFYSMKDIQTAWKMGAISFNPADRKAHGNLPLIEYYLRAFKAAEDADPKHTRFLDYLDLHTYFAANDAGLKPAGATDKQQAVIDSTRVFWDSTYKDKMFIDPDNPGPFLSNPAAPYIIRRMKSWIDSNYPGTKTAITEYNWGGMEHISGAVAQADILGIFGREGLDLATLWGPPDPKTQQPGVNAFKIFRNYDNAGGEFGDKSLIATSADQSKLSVYAALRSADKALTIVVINKTYGDLQGDLPLANFKASGPAKVFQYSNVDLTQIRPLPPTTVSAPAKGSKTSTLRNQTFPAMSITLYVVPKR